LVIDNVVGQHQFGRWAKVGFWPFSACREGPQSTDAVIRDRQADPLVSP
jgi:hypothetical protein